MTGATLVSSRGAVLTLAAAHLESIGRAVSASDGAVQVTDERGRLYTLHNNANPDWEWQTNVDTTLHALPADWVSMHGYAVECRWEDVFTEVTEQIAASAPDAVWVVDGDRVLWLASGLLPEALRL